jgi:hypothetical protein
MSGGLIVLGELITEPSAVAPDAVGHIHDESNQLSFVTAEDRQ